MERKEYKQICLLKEHVDVWLIRDAGGSGWASAGSSKGRCIFSVKLSDFTVWRHT